MLAEKIELVKAAAQVSGVVVLSWLIDTGAAIHTTVDSDCVALCSTV